MLSLNSLGNLPQDSRIAAEAKPKARPHDEQKTQADFSVYMAALVQPVKTEAPAPYAARVAEATPAEKPAAVQNTNPAPAQAETPAAQLQKAGHEAAGERTENSTTSPKEVKAERESDEARTVKAHAVRSDKELLEALGLITKKSPAGASEALQKVLRPELTEQALLPKARVANAVKAQSAASTLQQLQKAPDLILGNSEGLKRLGEKLGLVFLGKVGEKLGEKAAKADTSQTSTKGESKTEIITPVNTTRVQKAGDGTPEQQSGFQNSSRSARSMPVKNVSRETIAADTAEKPAPLGGSDLKPVSLPETATGRLHTAAAPEHRLAESVTTLRTAENIRSAVENPLMRADLVRQFNEVMGRAQVLVADSQNAQFSVKLFPRELGRMEIDLKMVEGEIRGKIVVESEDVKNEMQNFLQQRDNSAAEQQIDLNRIDIEVRSGNQHAQNPERTPDADTLLQNLVTRAAASAYEAGDNTSSGGSALYA